MQCNPENLHQKSDFLRIKQMYELSKVHIFRATLYSFANVLVNVMVTLEFSLVFYPFFF